MTAAAAPQRWSLGLSPRTFRRLLVAYLLLNGLRLGLWLLPFSRLHRLVDRLGRRFSQVPCPSGPDPDPIESQGQGQLVARSTNSVQATSAQAIAALVQLVARYSPGQVKCLAKALATQVLLRRRGDQPQLHIGVARSEGDRLQAHAWVELSGEVVMGQVDDLDRYHPLPALDEVLS